MPDESRVDGSEVSSREKVMKKVFLPVRTEREYWLGRLVKVNGRNLIHGTKLFSILENPEASKYQIVSNWDTEKERDEEYEWLVNECLMRSYDADSRHFAIEAVYDFQTAFQAMLYNKAEAEEIKGDTTMDLRFS